MNNSSVEPKEDDNTPFMPKTPDPTWYWSIRCFIAVVGWIGNGLVIYIIARSRRLQITSNWFVMSLAVADLCVTLIVAIPEFICSVFLDCDWWSIKVLYDVFLYASVLNLCAMTFDRYFAIVHPLRYQRIMTSCFAMAILISTWITAVLIPLPYYIALRMNQYELFSTLQMLVRLILEVLPCFILLITYLHMAYIARKQMRRVVQQRKQLSYNYNVPCQALSPRPKGSVRAVGLVVLIFLCCYSVAAYKGYINYVNFEKVQKEIVGLARFLYHLNSASNCIVYALCRQDVRNEVMQVVCYKKRSILTINNNIPEIQMSHNESRRKKSLSIESAADK
ncbi:octopamine receptor beta-2R-like [Actinia tenebrosa]|uniref:Octopamine receptor beta-2R-like n=1 Tax=Actinia tenebrosa TaxID=6105 RepID=A0A6P8J8P0_ACTTE|nr:octopamine receptor beta-2R-like [Actinia tenebrosa]